MTALSAAKALVKYNGSPLPCSIPLVQKTGTTIYPGALCAVATDGYCRPARTSTTDTVVGYAKKNPASQTGNYTSSVAGDSIVEVAAGVIKMNNSADADEITITEMWDFVYVVDDQTVAKTDGTGTRIRAGRCVGLDTGGVFVLVGLMMTAGDAVTLTGAETLTNKVLTTPTIADFTNSTHDHEDAAGGGQITPADAFDAAVPVALGGTNLTSFTAGDVLYATGATTLAKLAKGTARQALKMNSGATAPEWVSTLAGLLTAAGADAVAYDVGNDFAPASIVSGTHYIVTATAAASTITLPAAAAAGTWCLFSADGTENGHTVTYNDATGPTALTTALTASKRHLVLAFSDGAVWTALAYVGP